MTILGFAGASVATANVVIVGVLVVGYAVGRCTSISPPLTALRRTSIEVDRYDTASTRGPLIANFKSEGDPPFGALANDRRSIANDLGPLRGALRHCDELVRRQRFCEQISLGEVAAELP